MNGDKMKELNKNHNCKEIRKVFAVFNKTTIRVYQAYNDRIADEALRLGRFGSGFKMDRMTWIKPSFLWMMYRSGWATKEGQERILAIDIKRTGFDIILANVVFSSFDEKIYRSYEGWKLKLHNSVVRCQWDPDRDIYGNSLNRRAIQLGLKGNMVHKYVYEWVERINDITDYVTQLKNAIKTNTLEESMLPSECEYPVDEHIKRVVGIID
jgi:hypothetical protein